MATIDPTKLLQYSGAEISYENKWNDNDPPPRQSQKDYTRVRSIFIPLRPSEWCELCMRDGESYIGGCCGTSSAIQDIINGIFRESGYAEAQDLYDLGELTQSHPDGFEEDGFIGDLTQEEFDERTSKWDTFSPWEKIGLCYQAVKDKIRPYPSRVEPIVQENRPDLDEKREINELYGCIHYLRYASILQQEDDERGQKHANDIHTLAKMLPGTRRLLKKLESSLDSWTGVAIVEKDRPETICYNGYGLCLYKNKAEAKKVMALWNENQNTSDKVLIRSLTISVQKGVEFHKENDNAEKVS